MRNINMIVIHYTASDDVPISTIDAWHKAKGWWGVGYHKGIRKDGTIENGRSEDMIGAHCRGYNKTSLGVYLTGADTLPWYPTEEQYHSLIDVVVDWINIYDIPLSNVFFHKEKVITACPGKLDKTKVILLQSGTLVTPKIAIDPYENYLILKVTKPMMHNHFVVLCQQRLNMHRVLIKVDGWYGNQTKEGVVKFQSFVHNNIEKIGVDGIVGRKTWRWLFNPPG